MLRPSTVDDHKLHASPIAILTCSSSLRSYKRTFFCRYYSGASPLLFELEFREFFERRVAYTIQCVKTYWSSAISETRFQMQGGRRAKAQT